MAKVSQNKERGDTATREEIREGETSGQFRKHMPSTEKFHQTGKHRSDADKAGTSGENRGRHEELERQRGK